MQNVYMIDPIDALKMAIQSEREMNNYYRKAVNLFDDEELRSIMNDFSKKASDNRQKAVDAYSSFSGKRILYLNLDRRHRLNTLIRCGSDPKEAIIMAKRNEKELSEFYETVSHRFMQGDLRAFFRELSDFHRDHLSFLETTFEEAAALEESETVEANQEPKSAEAA